MAAALLIKVGALLLKTMAKPLSTRFEKWVMSHPVARQRIVHAAQTMHRFEVIISRRADGKTGRAFVGDMTEAKSLELASKLASEGFIFMVGMLIVTFEFERQRRKDVAKKKQEEMERQAILDQARLERERLMDENREQQDLIQQLFVRVQKVEDMQRLLEEERSKQGHKSMWGGFFGLRGLT